MKTNHALTGEDWISGDIFLGCLLHLMSEQLKCDLYSIKHNRLLGSRKRCNLIYWSIVNVIFYGLISLSGKVKDTTTLMVWDIDKHNSSNLCSFIDGINIIFIITFG
jgi:hypothetical protein